MFHVKPVGSLTMKALVCENNIILVVVLLKQLRSLLCSLIADIGHCKLSIRLSNKVKRFYSCHLDEYELGSQGLGKVEFRARRQKLEI